MPSTIVQNNHIHKKNTTGSLFVDGSGGPDTNILPFFYFKIMTDIIEEWRPVVGYEGLYEVSNTGQVINIKTGHILKQHKDKDGYWVLSLKRDKYKTYFAHRLVAQAFIPNPDNLPMVNHKDEDKSNCMVDNLEWCDAKYNSTYGTARERMYEAKHRKTILKRELEKRELEKSWAKIEKSCAKLMKKLKI